MKFDMHTHHYRCGHACGTIEDYIKAAIERELQVIGISDHSPYFAEEEDHAQPGITMKKSEFADYVEEVLMLKEKYADKIDVLLGVESDFFPEQMDAYYREYERYPFDYKIGSVHYVDGVSIFNRNRWKKLREEEMISLKERYYEIIQQSARSKQFHILSHIDAMKAYYPPFSDIPTDIVEKTMKVIADADVSIEVNTSGKTKDVGGWYPADDILELAYHYGVTITFGSDAHVPERVGDEFDDVKARLQEIGFRSWVYYKNGQRVVVPF